LTVTFTPSDTAVPKVWIDSPAGGTFETSSSSIKLLGGASDNVGVKEVIWKNSTKDDGGIAIGTETWSIADIQLSEGDSVLTVTAKDVAGNQSSSTLVVTYTPVDTTAPTVLITSPEGSTYKTTSSPINLSGTAKDNMGVAQVVWSNSQGGSDVASGTTDWSITDVDLAEGANVITVTAYDTAEQANSASSILTVTYTPPDTIDPLISIELPTGDSTYATDSSPIDLSGSAEDNVGVDKVTWANSRGGGGTASDTTSWSISGITLLEGDNVLKVIAEDAAGNQSTDTLTVAYSPPVPTPVTTAPPKDTTAPVVRITSPTTRSKTRTRESSISLAGSASDNVGVTQVTWANSLGGGGAASGTSSWSITNIPLKKGANVLTVTAKDAAENQSTDTLTVNKK
jgi:hypothetical protein